MRFIFCLNFMVKYIDKEREQDIVILMPNTYRESLKDISLRVLETFFRVGGFDIL